MDLDIKLCDVCERKMIKALEAEGVRGLTTEEMIAEEAELSAPDAISFAMDGNYLMRKGDQYPFTVRNVEINGSMVPQFCIVDENYKTIAYKSFTAEELFANDYLIIE